MKILNLLNLFLILSLATISGCSKPYHESSVNPYRGNCITPYSNYAYRLHEIAIDYFPEEIGPSEDWSQISSLPDPYIANKIIYFDDDLWILGYSGDLGNAVLRYNIESQKWKIYPHSFGFSMVLTSDNVLWGITNSVETFDELSALSRYNPQEDHFEYVIDKDGILKKELRRIYGAAINKEGNIWLTDGYGLYEYNTKNNEIKLHLQASEGTFFTEISISPDNVVWIVDKGKKMLVQYSPNSGEVAEFKIPLEILGTDELSINYTYIDHSGNLWFEDRGWVDLASLSEPDSDNYAWYFVIRSPEFIAPSIPNNKSLWMRPHSMYESSNGTFWFTSAAGVISLNPTSGKWCKIATSGKTIEDGDKNIWLLYNETLYMYPSNR